MHDWWQGSNYDRFNARVLLEEGNMEDIVYVRPGR
jgi:hypothetical protein